MNIGCTTIYAHRPHVAQMAYLAGLLEGAGHRTCFLGCDASVPACHNLLLKDTTRLHECPRCIAGGLRSFPLGPVDRLRSADAAGLPAARLDELTASSAYRLHLTEAPADRMLPEVTATQRALHRAVDVAYGSARRWIRSRRLEGVLLYNGRMDMTRGVLEACRDEGIPFLAVETPWTGHGVALTPNQMCLATADADRLVREFRDRPLSRSQGEVALEVLARRFRRQNALEWRVYNSGAQPATWPGGTRGPRVLVLPSSRNEVEGHPDWACEWEDYTLAFEAVLTRLDLWRGQVVLRCHPNWAERFGHRSGIRSEAHYRGWGERHRFHVIPSEDRADTYDLLNTADVVLVNGSTAGLEAAALGRPTVSIGHSLYQEAGIALQAHTWAAIEALSLADWPGAETVRRRALRYVYTYGNRLNQYVPYVRATSAAVRYFLPGADPARLERLLASGRVEADDAAWAADDREEAAVVERLGQRAWGAPALPAMIPSDALPIRRRFPLRWLDGVRAKLPPGDRM